MSDVARLAASGPHGQPVMAARQPQIRPAAIQQASGGLVARDGNEAVAVAPADPAFLQSAEHSPVPRSRVAVRFIAQPFQLDPGDCKRGIGEVKEAEFEAPDILAVDAVLGRHLENQRRAVALQFGRGEVAPRLLKPAQHDHLDPEHRLRRHSRPACVAAKAQPVGTGRQMQVRAVQDAARRLAAPDPGRSVRPPHPDCRILEARQKRPMPLRHRLARLGRAARLRGRRAGEIGRHRHHFRLSNQQLGRERPAGAGSLTISGRDCSVRPGDGAI